MKYEVESIKKTCEGYPTQWEGKLKNGGMIYVRYRWGWLGVRISKNITNDIDDAVKGKYIYYKQIGGEYDGVMRDGTMLSFLKNIINIEEQE